MKCIILAAMMTLSFVNAGLIWQPAQYPFGGASRLYYSEPSVQIPGPRAIYRASNLGVSHQAELPLGFNEPVIIENLAPASIASSERVFAAPQPQQAIVVAPIQPQSEIFAAHAPAPALPVTTYEASNAGVTHRASLVGFSHPVVIKNMDSAPGVPEPLAAPEPIPEVPSTLENEGTPIELAEPAQSAPASDLPITTYEASNPGVTHSSPLVGYSNPVVIRNLESAPIAVAQEPLAPALPASSAQPTAVYRASNLGIIHEAILPGHTKSVISENLEPAAPAASPAFVTVQAPSVPFAAYRFV